MLLRQDGAFVGGLVIDYAFVRSHFERLSSSLFESHGLDLKDEHCRSVMRELLSELTFSNFTSNCAKTHELADSLLEELIELQASEPLSDERESKIRAACEELRLRMVAMTLGKRVDSDGSVDAISSPPIVEACGMSHAVFGDMLVILLPRMTSDADQWAVNHCMDRLDDLVPGNVSWTLDFSALERLPIQVLSNVIFHIARLRDAGQKLHITFLKKDLLTESQERALVRLLEMTEVGGSYFSDSFLSECSGSEG